MTNYEWLDKRGELADFFNDLLDPLLSTTEFSNKYNIRQIVRPNDRDKDFYKISTGAVIAEWLKADANVSKYLKCESVLNAIATAQTRFQGYEKVDDFVRELRRELGLRKTREFKDD